MPAQLSDNKDADVTLALRSFREGDKVKAVILSIDQEKRRISLGLKPSYFEEKDFEQEESEEEEEDELRSSPALGVVEDEEDEEDEDEGEEAIEDGDDEVFIEFLDYGEGETQSLQELLSAHGLPVVHETLDDDGNWVRSEEEESDGEEKREEREPHARDEL